MTSETRRQVFRYGIPIDLVVLGTGIGLLFPRIGLLIALYLLAVAVSAWKGGWRSGLTAMIVALPALFGIFGDSLHGSQLAAFVIIAVTLCVVSGLRRWPVHRPRATLLPGDLAAGAAFEQPVAAPTGEPWLRQWIADMATTLAARREALERRAREKRDRLRRWIGEIAAKLAAQRETIEREAREKKELRQRLAAERAEFQRAAAERVATGRANIEETKRADERVAPLAAPVAVRGPSPLRRWIGDIEAKRAARRETIERLAQEQKELRQRLAAEREARQRAAAERAASERAEIERAKLANVPAASTLAPKPQWGGTRFTTWLRRSGPGRPAVNLNLTKIPTNAAPIRRAAVPQPRPVVQGPRKPRILLHERHRGSADSVLPQLKARGIEVEVVERWIDAVDEIFRFRPDAIFLDTELPDFIGIYRSLVRHSPNLPIVLTVQTGPLPNVPRAASAVRPYDPERLSHIARKAMTESKAMVARQSRPVPPGNQIFLAAQKKAAVGDLQQSGRYEITCVTCSIAFSAVEGEWCSCLTKERTLICPNCLMCFCKAPPSYRENFWLNAPPRLFERRNDELRRQQMPVTENIPPEQVRRPLVMLVEDDKDIPGIVKAICDRLGYGFVAANNGQDGLTLARLYFPNLILADAFMPKLDGREMCRVLKEELWSSDCRMVIMTGLYTDMKYKTEALKRFRVDDYLSKPVSITDLIDVLQKYLEDLPSKEEKVPNHHIPLSELLESTAASQARLPIAALEGTKEPERYPLCCFTCGKIFDAAEADWCTCLGRDQTLVCPYCNNCFCKAPAPWNGRFWVDAPSSLFERKIVGSKRNGVVLLNPSAAEVKRPLILLVEDDENIQLIVKTVVTTMGYGFIVGANGEEGLALAREYKPNLILSDAFMPKLDGREMCRLLKEDPATARVKVIIITGLYTDRKYRDEALSYFKVDDYAAKPLSVDDLIKLMKKHLPQEVQPSTPEHSSVG
jgi:CheY-like chemotaxis protein